jgi:hypothetical protein
MVVLNPLRGQNITVLPVTALELGYLGNIGGLGLDLLATSSR